MKITIELAKTIDQSQTSTGYRIRGTRKRDGAEKVYVCVFETNDLHDGRESQSVRVVAMGAV